MQYTFSAIDSSPLDITIQGLLFDSMLAVRTLHLKVGADVILIRHIDNSLSTGASGRVVDFVDEGPVVEFLMFDGTTRRETISLYKWTLSHDTVSHASRLQVCSFLWLEQCANICRSKIPLLPACSATVCKVRGYTLDRVNVDFSKIANHGWVAFHTCFASPLSLTQARPILPYLEQRLWIHWRYSTLTRLV